jgi:hypothetical protein
MANYYNILIFGLILLNLFLPTTMVDLVVLFILLMGGGFFMCIKLTFGNLKASCAMLTGPITVVMLFHGFYYQDSIFRQKTRDCLNDALILDTEGNLIFPRI